MTEASVAKCYKIYENKQCYKKRQDKTCIWRGILNKKKSIFIE